MDPIKNASTGVRSTLADAFTHPRLLQIISIVCSLAAALLLLSSIVLLFATDYSSAEGLTRLLVSTYASLFSLIALGTEFAISQSSLYTPRIF